MDALCALLLLQALPSSALWGIGWLLLQVFGLRKAGRACSCLNSSVSARVPPDGMRSVSSRMPQNC